MVQGSPGLNPDCFGGVKSFSEKKKKMKTSCYKVTVQTLYCIPGEEKPGW